MERTSWVVVLVPVLYNNINSTHTQCFKYVENASWAMVVVPVLYNNIHPKTLIHISRLGREINHHPCTSAQPCSRPGKHAPTAQITNLASVRLYYRPGKHPLTAHLHSHTVWLLQGFGSLPNRLWETPYTTDSSSLLSPSLLRLVPC